MPELGVSSKEIPS